MKNLSFFAFFGGIFFFLILLGFLAKCLRPVTCLREQDISFFSLLLSFSYFFSCQAVTAAEKGQGGMDSAVSVAHKLHLIGAWLMDCGPGVSQCHWAQACTRIHRIATSSWQRRLNEWWAMCVCFLNVIQTFLLVSRLRVLEMYRLILDDEEMDGKRGIDTH